MSEPICVCGHTKDQHDKVHLTDEHGVEHDLRSHCKDTCGCHQWRPVLSWPDEAGLWWLYIAGALVIRPVMVRDNDGALEVENMFSLGDWLVHRTLDPFDPRFTKVLETNPFGET